MESPVVYFSYNGNRKSYTFSEIDADNVLHGLGIDCTSWELTTKDVIQDEDRDTLYVGNLEISSDVEVLEAISDYIVSELRYDRAICDIIREILVLLCNMRRDYAYITTNGSKWIAENPYIAYVENDGFLDGLNCQHKKIYLKDDDNNISFSWTGACWIDRLRLIKENMLTVDMVVSAVVSIGLLNIHTQEYKEGVCIIHFEESATCRDILTNIILSVNRYVEVGKRRKSAMK